MMLITQTQLSEVLYDQQIHSVIAEADEMFGVHSSFIAEPSSNTFGQIDVHRLRIALTRIT